MNDKWPSTGRSVFLPMNQRGHVPWLTEGGQSDTVWFLCHLSVHVSLSPPFKIHAAHRPRPAPPWELFHSKSGYLKLPQRRDHLEKLQRGGKTCPRKAGWAGPSTVDSSHWNPRHWWSRGKPVPAEPQAYKYFPQCKVLGYLLHNHCN